MLQASTIVPVHETGTPQNGGERETPALTAHRIGEIIYQASLRPEIGFQFKLGKVGVVPLRASFIQKVTNQRPDVEIDDSGFPIFKFGGFAFRPGNKDHNKKFLFWLVAFQVDVAAKNPNRSQLESCLFDKL